MTDKVNTTQQAKQESLGWIHIRIWFHTGYVNLNYSAFFLGQPSKDWLIEDFFTSPVHHERWSQGWSQHMNLYKVSLLTCEGPLLLLLRSHAVIAADSLASSVSRCLCRKRDLNRSAKLVRAYSMRKEETDRKRRGKNYDYTLKADRNTTPQQARACSCYFFLLLWVNAKTDKKKKKKKKKKFADAN